MGKTKKLLKYFLLAGIVFFMMNNAYAADPVATILYPSDNSIFSKGDSLILRGNGTDADDGELTGNQIIWKSNKDGLLGKGVEIAVFLSEGNHAITLKVIDKDDNINSSQINIIIEEKK